MITVSNQQSILSATGRDVRDTNSKLRQKINRLSVFLQATSGDK